MNDRYFRYMGLDLGDRRIGIALSDIMGIISNGLESYTRVSIDSDLNHIAKIIAEQNVKVVVLGYPVNMNGTKGDATRKVEEFAERLKEVVPDIKVEFMDERLTTVAAQKVLIEADMTRQKRKTVVDKLAATIILQDYLNIKKGD